MFMPVNKRKIKKPKIENSLNKNKADGRPVFVEVVHKTKHSQHVVDLKEKPSKKTDNTLWRMPIYKEKKTIGKIERRETEVPSPKSQVKSSIRKSYSFFSLFIIFKKISSFFYELNDSVRSFFSALLQKFSLQKLSFVLITIGLVAILPLPTFSYYQKIKIDSNKIVEESTNAFLALQSSTLAAIHANLAQAKYDLNNALFSFNQAKDIVDREHKIVSFVAGLVPVIGKQVQARQNLLTAGQHLALGNTYLVKGIEEANISSTTPVTDKLNILASHLAWTIPQYESALKEMSKIDNAAVPVEYQNTFSEFKLVFGAFVDDLTDIGNLLKGINAVLGQEGFRRYLLVFQNNHELRPTGGFMGSFATIDVQKGKILKIDIPKGGTYDLQGQLDVYLKPPLALQISNKRWEFQDANWFADFSVSAQKIAWFYQHARGVTVDGVIAVNATVLERVLNSIGPMENKDHGLLLTANNALEDLQYKVELDYDRNKKEPKAVIGDLAIQTIDTVKEKLISDYPSIIKLFAELQTAASEKEIQFYFTESNVLNIFREFGWTGEMQKVANGSDYLMVVNTNVAGFKTDAKIDQYVVHQAEIQEDGSVVDTVKIRRVHNGKPEETFYGSPNVDYLRVYVPEGAEFIEAGGFSYPNEELFKVPDTWCQDDPDILSVEKNSKIDVKSGTKISVEAGKTVFSNWLIVEPQETGEVYFVYRLPFKILKDAVQREKTEWQQFGAKVTGIKNSFSYSLLTQKQSGLENNKFSTRIIYPDNWQTIWRSAEDLRLAGNGVSLEEKTMDKDFYYGVIARENE